MKTKRIKPRKVRANLAITKEAQDIMFDHGYASQRTVGMFISHLIVDYHARQTRKLTQAEIVQELRRLVSLLEDNAAGLVGVTVISEEPFSNC
jgi:hypothetical protein